MVSACSYADSWLSYGIPATEKDKRVKAFSPYRVTELLMKQAKS